MTAAQLRHHAMTLLDYVNELTRPHQHREHYTRKVGATTYGQHHVTQVPPLLHQLRFASPSGLGEERGAGGYESRPALSLDAIDTLTRIEHQATEWLGRLDEAIRVQALRTMTLAQVLQRLGGLHAGVADLGVRRDLEHDVRRWWAQARVVTGWDSPAWRPDNSCPMCGEHGTLRVRLAEKVGLCVECRETWDETNIGLLADHIRLESTAGRPTAEAERCWCPWPVPPFAFRAGRWGALCPACGTRTCHRARSAGRMSA